MDSRQDTIKSFDPEVWSVIERETQRQEDHIELIASENYASRALAAQVRF
jgi:glycine hydroxymethyltransferase